MPTTHVYLDHSQKAEGVKHGNFYMEQFSAHV